MSRLELISCFRDTVQLSYSMPVYKSTVEAQNSNHVYYENFIAKKCNLRCKGEVIIEDKMPFTVAKECRMFGKTAVVNCANPLMPGGGIEDGLMGQEECLGRSSNLAICLNGLNVVSEFYDYQKNKGTPYYSDRIIYTRDVTVMKNDERIPSVFTRSDWFCVDVLSCSAPKVSENEVSEQDLKSIIKRRIKNIFEVALGNQIEILILGIFGCENSGCSPHTVAVAFKEVIEEQQYNIYFKKIIFALHSYMIPDCAKIFDSVWYKSKAEMDDDVILSEFLEEKSHSLPENKKETPYTRKKVSILGDSISTLEGFNPEKYKVHYTGETCVYNGIHKMKDTWWGMVIDRLGSELLINNSYSGSRVTGRMNQDGLFPSGCSDERTKGLHIGNEKPDVILVYMGTNDWMKGVKHENNGTSLIGNENYEVFRFAYETMLYKLKLNYPKSEIWCCTLCKTTIKSQPDFRFPDMYGGISIENYNEIIRDVVPLYDCRLIDLYRYEKPYDTLDGTHPTFDGMKLLAELVADTMTGDCSKINGLVEDCCNVDNVKNEFEMAGMEETAVLNLDLNKNSITDDWTTLQFPSVIQLKIVNSGELIQIDKEMFIVGRHLECDLRFNREQKHLVIGRRHATFYYEKGFWYLQDHSTNGTWINGERMESYKKYKLKRNDMIDFAGREKVFFFPKR